MPKFNISTYASIGGKYTVNKIVSEVENVEKLTKSVSVFDKYSSKHSFKECFKGTNSNLTQGTERC